MTRILYWTPRVLGILFAAFISIFALDVFSEGYGFWETMLALFMHLIPTFIIVIMLVIAWKRALVGGILFVVIPLFFLIMSKWRSWVVPGPLMFIGCLFIMHWVLYRKQHIN
ncbi:MAG: hypothetical protein GF384_01285 [Elusimicrobia bacterium]|nr:hypothetical protein [Elusimicrobiota bacterium]